LDNFKKSSMQKFWIDIKSKDFLMLVACLQTKNGKNFMSFLSASNKAKNSD
jgi:hypothetical protein